MKRILTLALTLTIVQFAFAQNKSTEGLKRIDQGSDAEELAELDELAELGELGELEELAELQNLSQLSSLSELSSLSALSELSSLSQLSSLAELSSLEAETVSMVIPAIEIGLSVGLGPMFKSLESLDVSIEKSVMESMDSLKLDQIIEEAIQDAYEDQDDQ